MKLVDVLFTEATMTVGDHTQGSSPGPNYGVLGMNATGPAQPDAVRAKLLQGTEPGSANRDLPLDKIKEGFMDDYEDPDHPVVQQHKALAQDASDLTQTVVEKVATSFIGDHWNLIKNVSDGFLGFPRHILRFKNAKLNLYMRIVLKMNKVGSCDVSIDNDVGFPVQQSFKFSSEEELLELLPRVYDVVFAKVHANVQEGVHAVSGPVNTDKTWGKDVVHSENNYQKLREMVDSAVKKMLNTSKPKRNGLKESDINMNGATDKNEMLFDNNQGSFQVGELVKMKDLEHLPPGTVEDVRTFPNGETKYYVVWPTDRSLRTRPPLNASDLVRA